MVRFAALLAISVVLCAQNLCINSGGPAIPPAQPNGPCAFIADQYSTTGTIWGPGAPGYIPLPTGVLADLRYGSSFNYDIPIANGLYSIKFDLIEPTQSAVNLRRFTINANGIQSDPLDLFALTGGVGVPYSLVMNSVPVLNGNLHIIFAATIRSAVVAGIEITFIPPPPPPPVPLIGTRKPCVNPIDAPNPIMVMLFGDGSCSEIKILQPGDTAQNGSPSSPVLAGIPCSPSTGYALRVKLPGGDCLPVEVYGPTQGSSGRSGALAQKRPPLTDRSDWWDIDLPGWRLSDKTCPAYWTRPGIPCLLVGRNLNGGQGYVAVPVGIPVNNR